MTVASCPAPCASAVLVAGVILAAPPVRVDAAPPPGGMAALASWGPAALGRGARAAAIERFAQAWLGTPYRWGGTSRSGIDCSAYLREMFRDLFAVELPRTTRQQIRLGVDLAIRPPRLDADLEPGDIIFYINRMGVPHHVVVYAGNGHITHSVSGRGVVVEPIETIRGRRIAARRFLVPARGGGPSSRSSSARGGFAPIPAAGPLAVTEIPCPSGIRLSRTELASLRRRPLDDPGAFGGRELCEVRALADALAGAEGWIARANAERLRRIAISIESFETAGALLFGE